MKTRGGKRPNAGRKSKAEEQSLIEKLSPMEGLAHSKLLEAIEEGKDWAVRMYIEYMYAKPTQKVDQKTELSYPTNDMNEWQ